jgi:hypothetical protein
MAAAVTTAKPVSAVADKRFTGQHDIVSWAYDLLGLLGVPATPTNVGILIKWANTESGGYNPGASGGRNNPLNTTQTGPGWVGGGGSQGNISDFDTYEHGLQAQAANLKNPRFGYPAILAALKQGNNAAGVFAAIDASSFGTHFGSGAQPAPVTPGSGGTPGGIGGGGTDATLTGSPLDVIGGFAGDVFSNVPGLGGLIGAATLPGKLAGLFIGVFANWRYALELVTGGIMVLLGLWLIAKDTGAVSAGKQRATDAAAVAAVAA